MLAVLIDPDKFNPKVVLNSIKAKVDFFFVGGSSVKKSDFIKTINFIRRRTQIPLVIFPGDEKQISSKANALLLLSLVSGRNPEYLIGKHVKAAKNLKKSNIEIIPTAYIMVDGGTDSSAATVTKTRGIKQNNSREILDTALASEMLGMQLIYLEAGSGAKVTVGRKLISQLKKKINIPIICGGGIDSVDKLVNCWKAGCDIAVVGNALESNPELIFDLKSTGK